MPHSSSGTITVNGNNSPDVLLGTFRNEVLNGSGGNDTLQGGGGTDKLNGGAGDDLLRAMDGSGLVGLRAGAGNDTLEAAIETGGQAHMFGGGGDDLLRMDLTKAPNLTGNGQWRQYDGHHAYGGDGRDVFNFTSHTAAQGIVTGRIDDFDASQDSICVKGETLDFDDLPGYIRLFSYNGQQWLKIGQNAYYTLEGARFGGGEDHFFKSVSALESMLAASTGPSVDFVDQRNYVPAFLYESVTSSLQRHIMMGEGNTSDFIGSQDNDYVYDQRTRGGHDPVTSVAVTFYGYGGDDVINAGKGADTVFGGTGNDFLAGGMDRDLLFGDDGNDWIFGGSEADAAFGGAGHDSIEGGSGRDQLFGGEGDDLLRGGAGRDLLGGGNGNDRMSGENGRDTVDGYTGNDTLYGGDGKDLLRGALDDDALYGQNGNDSLYGGAGEDHLVGGRGHDVINGGAGRDIAFGGSGADSFVFRTGALVDWDNLTGTTNQRLTRLDRIEDFSLASDQIVFHDYEGVRNAGDLRGWQTDFNGDRYMVVSVQATDARLMIKVQDTGLTWSDLVAADSFAFV